MQKTVKLKMKKKELRKMRKKNNFNFDFVIVIHSACKCKEKSSLQFLTATMLFIRLILHFHSHRFLNSQVKNIATAKEQNDEETAAKKKVESKEREREPIVKRLRSRYRKSIFRHHYYFSMHKVDVESKFIPEQNVKF